MKATLSKFPNLLSEIEFLFRKLPHRSCISVFPGLANRDLFVRIWWTGESICFGPNTRILDIAELTKSHAPSLTLFDQPLVIAQLKND